MSCLTLPPQSAIRGPEMVQADAPTLMERAVAFFSVKE